MRITEHPDAGTFLAATESIRASDPVLTNMIGSVAGSVVAGRRYQAELWLSVQADHVMVGCAMRTAPHHLIVSPMPESAAEEVGRFVRLADPDVTGVNGPRDTVEAVIRGLEPATRPRLLMVETVRVLGSYRPPPAPAGTARPAVASDLDVIVAWYEQFGLDAGLPIHDARAAVTARLEQGAMLLWIVDGAPVAMAGHATPVATPAGFVTRIGPVYTPARHRRRGYGAAITAAVTEAVLPGSAVVMLFADASKPENNRIYERLGFAAFAEIVEVSLRGEEQA